MKLIDLEAHFVTQAFADYTHNIVTHRTVPIDDRLLDLGEGRIRDMDEAGIDMQVLSLLLPHIQNLESSAAKTWARRTNEELSAAVKRYPDRFAGLAAIPVQSPHEAAEELERAVSELGLKGVCITSNAKNEYFDDEKYWVIFEKAEKLDVPIYLHPRAPSPSTVKPYLGYPQLATAMCGFGHEVALHALRLIVGSVFEEFPKLQIILGHLGEALPYWLWRVDNMWSRTEPKGIPKKAPSEYFKNNLQ